MLSHVRAICRKHFVRTQEIYLDAKSASIIAARLEVWHWLTLIGKSHGDIARLFDRDPSSVHYAMQKLTARAATEHVTLDATSAEHIARALGQEAASALSNAGKRAAASNNAAGRNPFTRSRVIMPIDGDEDPSKPR